MGVLGARPHAKTGVQVSSAAKRLLSNQIAAFVVMMWLQLYGMVMIYF